MNGPSEAQILQAYDLAKERYAAIGVLLDLGPFVFLPAHALEHIFTRQITSNMAY